MAQRQPHLLGIKNWDIFYSGRTASAFPRLYLRRIIFIPPSFNSAVARFSASRRGSVIPKDLSPLRKLTDPFE